MIGNIFKIKRGRGSKKKRCDACSRMLASDADLMNHKQVFHGKDLKYDCRKCDKYFASMEEMRTHLQREHRYEGDR